MTKSKFKTFLSFFYAVLIALLIRTIVFEPYSIPTGSMKPNFLVGDYLFVSKYKYGISNSSFPLDPPLIDGRILVLDKPQRGDVIVFKSPHERWTNYIKRLIGMPGDEIQLINGVVYINGTPADRKEEGTFTDTDGSVLQRYKETLPNGVSYYIAQENTYGSWSNTQVYKVPEGHYFFLGDNRDHSTDSRFGEYPIGFVPYKKLIGKAEEIIFSNPESIIYIWRWIFAFNKDRLFIRVKSL
ncbi:MAG: signal peptidase I [Pseudomonadota bacterium]